MFDATTERAIEWAGEKASEVLDRARSVSARMWTFAPQPVQRWAELGRELADRWLRLVLGAPEDTLGADPALPPASPAPETDEVIEGEELPLAVEVQPVEAQVIEAQPGVQYSLPGRPLLLLAPGAGTLQWGVNGWQSPPDSFGPADAALAEDGVARRSELTPQAAADGRYGILLPALGDEDAETFVHSLQYTIHFRDGDWWGHDAEIMVR